MIDSNKAIVQAFVKAVNRQDWDRLDHLVDPAFIRHSRAAGEPQVRSREDLKIFLRREFETFPDAREEIQFLLAEDDKVAARLSFTGTQSGPLGPFPASNRKVASDYLCIFRLAGGRIVESWAEWDNLTSLVQLGHYSPPESP